MGDRVRFVGDARQEAGERVQPDPPDRRLAFDDLVAERAQQLRRLLGRAAPVGVQPRGAAGRDAQRQRDPQRPRVRLRGRDEWPARDDLVQERRVVDAAREEAIHRQAAEDLVGRRRRHEPARGLQPEQSAGRGWRADRSGAVGRRRRGHKRRCDRRCRSPARAAGRALQVPRVARDASGQGLGEALGGELGRARDADDDRAGRPQPGDEGGVLRLGIAIGAGAADPRFAAERHVVLDGDRDAEQRLLVRGADPAGRGVGLCERLLGEDLAKRVELRVDLRDALERRLDELARSDGAAAYELGLLDDTGEGQLAALGGCRGAHLPA
ncbi:MAG TPA: hypothetical protein VNT54_13510 [Solirubrobacteraceae bacterium]|nr:hypothetical protein [Solirubrobacteraceae bacterium]